MKNYNGDIMGKHIDELISRYPKLEGNKESIVKSYDILGRAFARRELHKKNIQ